MELSNVIMFWATVLSPIVGVIAIIVALIIAHQSSKDTKKQILTQASMFSEQALRVL